MVLVQVADALVMCVNACMGGRRCKINLYELVENVNQVAQLITLLADGCVDPGQHRHDEHRMPVADNLARDGVVLR